MTQQTSKIQEHGPPVEKMTEADKKAWLLSYENLSKRRNKRVLIFLLALPVSFVLFLIFCAINDYIAMELLILSFWILYLAALIWQGPPYEENYLKEGEEITYNLRYADTHNGGSEKFPIASMKTRFKMLCQHLSGVFPDDLGDPSVLFKIPVAILGSLFIIFIYIPLYAIKRMIYEFFFIDLFRQKERILTGKAAPPDEDKVHVAGPKDIQIFEASGGTPSRKQIEDKD